MSVRVIDRVWRSGLYSGGTLLVLLAMADWANDSGGRVFPTTRQLATKSRMTERQVRTCVRQLESDGVIVLIQAATGRPGQANEYRIVLKNLQPVEDDETESTMESGDGGNNFRGEIQDTDGGSLRQEGRKSASQTAEVCDTAIDNRQEQPSKQPSSEPSGGAPTSDPVRLPGFETNEQDRVQPIRPKPSSVVISRADMDAAYELYNETAKASGWPKCQMRSNMRDGNIRRRMQEVGGLEGWRTAMEHAGQSDHLCGRSQRSAEFQNWKPDIDFFLTASKFTSLMEGKYDNRTGTQEPGAGGVLASAARVAARRAANGTH